MSRKLVLIRHGSIAEQWHGTLLGATNVSLSPEGRRQAEQLSKFLKILSPGKCFSSPMKRCIETAELSGFADQRPIEILHDLREADFGDWEGKKFRQIAEADPGGANRWAMFEPDFGFPGGEKMSDFIGRIASVSETLAASPEDTLTAFTHGGVIRFMICRLLGLSPEKYVLFDVGYASVTVINLFNGKGVLAGMYGTDDFGTM